MQEQVLFPVSVEIPTVVWSLVAVRVVLASAFKASFEIRFTLRNAYFGTSYLHEHSLIRTFLEPARSFCRRVPLDQCGTNLGSELLEKSQRKGKKQVFAVSPFRRSTKSRFRQNFR